ncbi:helix-turn-helix domain-containing protein [Dactylosporangium sp. NPDC051541]|uniref:helix-turn-helix domain-containing protein n=1 Tax=Dactylosporangium sp. NPDC051541 TaxID=3363977 RepID=UPI0037A7524C
MTTLSTPTARPQAVWGMIGRQLRAFRVARNISPAVAGQHIGAHESKISWIECGNVKVKEDDLERLLALYRVTGAECRAILDLTRRAGDRQWWYPHRDVLADWFCSYLVLESAAEVIRTYEVHFIPGILQTRAYAEAVMRQWYVDEAEVRRRVEVRMRRQEILHEQRSPHIWAVIDEAALRKQIGGPLVMREQLESLIEANEQRHMRIQILLSAAGGHVGMGNSFSILRLRNEHMPDVVYLEQIDSALFFTEREELDPYREAMTRINVAAGKPNETRNVIEQALRDAQSPR